MMVDFLAAQIKTARPLSRAVKYTLGREMYLHRQFHVNRRCVIIILCEDKILDIHQTFYR